VSPVLEVAQCLKVMGPVRIYALSGRKVKQLITGRSTWTLPSRALISWFRISLEAWISVHVCSVFVFFCVCR
jgi:hypothetical protein